MGSFFLVSGASLLAVVVVVTATALWARKVGHVSVIDIAWGLGFVAVALVAATVGDGDPLRRWLIAGLVAFWGLRLAWHISRKNKGKGEDPRYAEMLGEGGFALAVRKVFVTQGAAMWFVSLPVQVSAVTSPAWSVLIWIGVALWLVGVVFESVGDAQLAAYKADPNRGPVMDRGLWRFTRHPNYFGDACVWWGIWLIACAAWPGLLTILSPVAMTYFLVFATGARLLERTMMKRPGYPEYAARTSMFFPLPPKK